MLTAVDAAIYQDVADRLDEPVCAFGSRARGTAGPHSDYDIGLTGYNFIHTDPRHPRALADVSAAHGGTIVFDVRNVLAVPERSRLMVNPS